MNEAAIKRNVLRRVDGAFFPLLSNLNGMIDELDANGLHEESETLSRTFAILAMDRKIIQARLREFQGQAEAESAEQLTPDEIRDSEDRSI